MNLIGQKAKNAVINKIDSKTKNKVLQKYISLIEKNKNSIIRANKKMTISTIANFSLLLSFFIGYLFQYIMKRLSILYLQSIFIFFG